MTSVQHDGVIEIGVITGVGQAGPLQRLPALEVPTPYGPTSGPVRVGEIGGRRVAILARRGDRDGVQPHLVPHRANVWALASLGVRALITSTAATGLRDTFGPGTYVVPDQLVDDTRGRAGTFYDGDDDGGAGQISTADPFDPTLRALTIDALTPSRVRLRDFGTAAVIEGPRFVTAAEARWYAAAGADMVNMSLMPETALARELGVGVVNVSVITLREATDGSGVADLSTAETVRRRSAAAQGTLLDALPRLVASVPTGFQPAVLVHADRREAILARPPQEA